jgi:Mor family transcriptional regulator
LSIANWRGEAVGVEDRPVVVLPRAGSNDRIYDLAIYTAWQAGVPVNEIARKYRISRKTVWYRCRKVEAARAKARCVG